mmetsp:Transcript_16736/g.45323  ORF Transcript_16736/g.45323 Transcript_16736/m.45323 type:complete len:274 (+) Transcript_16736:987-1808(+)
MSRALIRASLALAFTPSSSGSSPSARSKACLALAFTSKSSLVSRAVVSAFLAILCTSSRSQPRSPQSSAESNATLAFSFTSFSFTCEACPTTLAFACAASESCTSSSLNASSNACLALAFNAFGSVFAWPSSNSVNMESMTSLPSVLACTCWSSSRSVWMSAIWSPSAPIPSWHNAATNACLAFAFAKSSISLQTPTVQGRESGTASRNTSSTSTSEGMYGMTSAVHPFNVCSTFSQVTSCGCRTSPRNLFHSAIAVKGCGWGGGQQGSKKIA